MFKDIFGDSPSARVLDFLADHPDSEYSITEIVERSGISRPTLYRIIEEVLQKQLVVRTRTIGNTPLYMLNTGNTLV